MKHLLRGIARVMIPCLIGGGTAQAQYSFPPASGTSASNYQTLRANGTALTQRAAFNLINGTNVTITCVDNSGANRTDCTIASAGGGSLTINGTTYSTLTLGSRLSITSTGGGSGTLDGAQTPCITSGSGAPTGTSGCGVGGVSAVGDLYVDTTANALYFRNSTTWQAVGAGTSLPTLTANQILGQNAAGNALEGKTLVAGLNVTITHGAGSVTIAAAGGGGGGCAPTETTFCTYEEFESDVNDSVTNSTTGVQYPYQRGRMSFALLAKSSLNFAYGTIAPTGTQTAPGWLYVQDAGPGTNVFGGVAWGGNRGGNTYSTRVESLYNKTLTLRVIPNSYGGNTSIYGIWSASTPLNPSSGTWGDPAGTAFCPVGIAGVFIAVNSGNGSSAHVCDGSGTNYRAALSAWQGASVPMTYTIAIGASPLSTSTLTFTSTPSGGSTTTATIASGTASRPSTTTYSQYVFIAGGLTAFSTWIDYIMYSGTR